ncbi:16S rRNA (guanine(527)-N(7))-methyltransferase RsmG [Roseomonas sp. NAR14]|uniref:Ribosomal RNA small subunit methyltransferase G n=1 Tax=Roseomonas acroporae TaxID=2937791 RepID=A0A9X1Y8E0_9PROT|nr:16S rRNA (guanine(527)-N(7))-methyltransferase RsmG [Roseomonas acroporae]
MKHATPRATPDVSRETQRALDAYLDLLLRWNERINLVAERDPAAIRHRHIADCLQLAAYLPPDDAPLGDFGSGAGFPGLVLAAVTTRPVHLVESDKRKAAFLLEASRTFALPHVTVHSERLERVALPPLGVVTARALAPLSSLLPIAAARLRPGGVALFPKGRTAEAELTQANADWTMHVERFPSVTDAAATILRLSEIRRAGAQD